MSNHLAFRVDDVPKLMEEAARSGAERVIDKLVTAYGKGDQNRGFAHLWTQGSLVGLTLEQLALTAHVSFVGTISTAVADKLPTSAELERSFNDSDRCPDCVTEYSALLERAAPFLIVTAAELKASRAHAEACFQDWLATGV